MEADEVEKEALELVAKITPQKIVALIEELMSRPQMADMKTLPLHELTGKILAEKGYDLISGAKLVEPLKKAIVKTIAQIPGMRFMGGG